MAHIQRNTIEIDATGQSVGRIATQIATYLMGKHKPSFEHHIDMGDIVRVVNASQVQFTGKKFVQKDYFHHTNYPGGLKTTSLKKVFEKSPDDVIRRAVNKMLPKNSHRTPRLKRLTITS